MNTRQKTKKRDFQVHGNVQSGNPEPIYGRKPIDRMLQSRKTQNQDQLPRSNLHVHKFGMEEEFKSTSGSQFPEPLFQVSDPVSLHPSGSLKSVNGNSSGQEQMEYNEYRETYDSSSSEEEEGAPSQAAARDTVIHSSPINTVQHRSRTDTVQHRSPRDTVQHQLATAQPIIEKQPDESYSSTPKKSKVLKKTTPTKSDSQYTILYWAVGALIAVIISVLGTILYYKNGLASLQTPNLHFGNFLPKTTPPPQIDIAAIMDALKRDFNEQPPMTFKIVKSAIQTLNRINPKEPAIIALLAEQGAEDVGSRFARQLAESVSKHNQVVTISGYAFSDQEPDTAKKAIDDLLNGGLKENMPGAVFVDRLDYIPGDAALIFHTYCDHENAPFKRVVYVMTVVSNETKLRSGGQKEWDTKFQEHLYKSWSVVGVDQISSLMSRLTVSVAAIVTKEEG